MEYSRSIQFTDEPDTIQQNRKPEDIGKLAVFLASDDSDYITGASIFIDGGMTTFESFSTGG
jgi:enoyl-[acyl-carrier-protein] reductase (NADH)